MAIPIIGPISKPIIGVLKEIIPLIPNIIGTIKDIFGESSSAIGETESISANSSPDNIEHIIQIFSELKEQVHSKTAVIENSAVEEVNYYAEELHNIFNANAEKINKYKIRIKQIERKIDAVSSKIPGTIDKEMSKIVSLDNPECNNIVKMISGTRKEEAIKTFLNSSLNKAIEVYCAELCASLDEIYENVEDEIAGAVETVQTQNEMLQASLDAVDKNNYEETAKKIITEAYYITDVCKMVSEII